MRQLTKPGLALLLALVLAACGGPREPLDTEKPTVTITAPASGATIEAGTDFTVSGTAADNVGVESVSVQLNDEGAVAAVLAEDGTWAVELAAPGGEGVHTITATAEDEAGNTGDDSLLITTIVSDTEAPVVEINTPVAGATFTVGEAVQLSGTAADNEQVRQVAIAVDDVQLLAVVPAADGSWSASWQPTTAGEFELSAVATDQAGNDSEPAAVTVTVGADPTVPGSVSGSLRRLAPEPATISSLGSADRGDIVPGQLFISFEHGRPDVQLGIASAGLDSAAAEGFSFHIDGNFSYQGVEFNELRAYPVPSGLSLYSFDGLTQSETWELAEELESTRSVRAALPNLIVHSLAVPGDPLYEWQAWHYEQLNLPNAWELETGDSNVVNVAVLDSGSYPHPDINWAAVGANFVNWAGDPPAPAEGDIDEPETIFPGSAHGTHVAGTIGALTNNGLTEGSPDVAGVNWHLQPIPVKVLGQSGSGTFAGVFEGLFWAAGFNFPEYGGHVNPRPAQVANLSLGGLWGDVCLADFNEIFEAIYQLTGMITIVAAGNDGSPANPYMPAACDAVITVGATGPTGARAYYSNYGSQVDVFAPGGDADYVHPVPELADAGVFAGVASTTWSLTGPTADTPIVGFSQGTSMAAPHVTGVVSLMLAAEPGLTRDEVRDRLHAASYPMSIEECGFTAPGLTGLNQCAAGLLDAEAALLNIEVAATTASVWAVPFEGETAPDLGYSDLNSLDLMTSFKTDAVGQLDGSFDYELSGLPPGDYLLVGLEQRWAEEGVGTMDRLATETVSIGADSALEVDLEVTPIYLILR